MHGRKLIIIIFIRGINYKNKYDYKENTIMKHTKHLHPNYINGQGTNGIRRPIQGVFPNI